MDEVLTHMSVGLVFFISPITILFFYISGIMDVQHVYFQRQIKEKWKEKEDKVSVTDLWAMCGNKTTKTATIVGHCFYF